MKRTRNMLIARYVDGKMFGGFGESHCSTMGVNADARRKLGTFVLESATCLTRQHLRVIRGRKTFDGEHMHPCTFFWSGIDLVLLSTQRARAVVFFFSTFASNISSIGNNAAKEIFSFIYFQHSRTTATGDTSSPFVGISVSESM